MTDRVGVTCGLVVLARVVDGRADAARAAIAALPARRSPFARVQGTSLARLQVLRPPRRRLAARRPREHLLWAADLDGPLDGWLARACAVIGPSSTPCSATARSGRAPQTPPASRAGWRPTACGSGSRSSARPRRASRRSATRWPSASAWPRFVRETQGLDDVALRDAWRRWRAG